ncbi:aminobenzoyl-glutamate utilization protein B [Paraburkholderia sp. BL27I4N3]|uniref:amidohydrolase n=1 Tax=Paraburkholderia sp. BL27I4N3 TaxID=1938805 RepID=UPI000E23446B|nr:amidohydrolase [Paraburkholderia sp. BL27I4N3]REE07368.1 aminobenzoyl-glutamate utilization protein B [Paraburkholderia sp. BL27I4N3]
MKHIASVVDRVETKGQEFIDLADEIWSLAEMRYAEFRSSELHASAIERAGFKVTRGVAGMPTAFVAEAGAGGPVIGFLGEYDALAGLSQQSGALTCVPNPDAATGNGHGCGHHLLGAASHLAAVVARDYFAANNIKATVRFYGCPAEEAAAGKTFMARAGLFDDLDVALCWHPSVASSVFMNATLANVQASFRFHGKSAHAALAPHLGRSALDAAELMNIGVNYLREHMPDLARVHFAYINSGGASTNVIPVLAEVLYTVRSPHSGDALDLFERVKQIAEGAAMMTGTRLDIIFDKACSNVLHNDTLDRVLDANMRAIGAFDVDARETEFAKQLQNTISADDLANCSRHFAAALRDPKPIITEILPYHPDVARPVTGSTDVGDVSWAAPTTQCLTACYAWGTGFHSWQMVAQGKQSLAHKGMLLAAKTLAATAIDLAGKPDVLHEAKQELHRKRGSRGYQCPIPPDVMPPPRRDASGKA